MQDISLALCFSCFPLHFQELTNIDNIYIQVIVKHNLYIYIYIHKEQYYSGYYFQSIHDQHSGPLHLEHFS